MRICSGAGCLRTVEDNVRLCAECADGMPQGKLTRVERGQTDPIMLEYGTQRWQKLRHIGLQAHPFCSGWGGDPCTEIARVANHNVPARTVVRVCKVLRLFPFEKWPGFYISPNLIGLCHSQHTKKTRVEDGMDWTAQLVTLLSRFLPKTMTDEEKANAIEQAAHTSR
jgi:hypothetical protein